ncbi:MAG: hypothetical protein IH886_07395 [Nitrospinae bacterium]|nr:hypothetical protein [Nitrospinota bacterium]
MEDWARGLVGRLQRKSKFFAKLALQAKSLTKKLEEDSSNFDEIKREMIRLIQSDNSLSKFIQLFDDALENKISGAINTDELKEACQKVKEALSQIPGPLEENYPLATVGPVPRWVLKILKQLAETLILIRKSMTFPMNKFTGRLFGGERTEDLLFNKFLGDVQLYGEYLPTRGRAVRRFHKLMWRIEKAHWEQEEEKQKRDKNYQKAEPKYTILAHSLGTVMSMDALVSAHVDMVKRSVTDNELPNLPFPGYLQGESKSDIWDFNTYLKRNNDFLEKKKNRELTPDDENQWETTRKNLEKVDNNLLFLNTEWKDNVDSYITLGSPIDKFLVLWWLNYQYLNLDKWKMIGEKRTKDGVEKIKHFNYTDEQDPVGHALDKFQDTQAFKSIFKKVEDRVFNRYVLPGVAHLKYWEDLELFRHIAHKAVDQINPPIKEPRWFKPWTYFRVDQTNPSTQEPGWFKPWVYIEVVFITYFLIPLGLTLVLFFIGTGALEEAEWYKQWPTIAAFVLAGWLSLRLIHLLVWWRQIMRQKASQHFIKKKEEKTDLWELQFRKFAAGIAGLLICLSPVGFFLLAWNFHQNFLLQPLERDFQLLQLCSLATFVFGWLAIDYAYLKLKNWARR